MKHLTRFFLLVAMAAILGINMGCATSGYEKGLKHYKPDDFVAAVRELKPLAEQGDATAQFNLGSLYYQGLGVSQDYKEAAKWMRKAAEQGHVFAQTTLGTIYAEGVQGVIEKDYPQALMCFIFAAAQGDMEAMEFRDTMANRMTPTQIAEAQRLAREFKPQNVYTKSFQEFKALGEQGDAVAQFKVGLIYYGGQGVPRDYLESLNWFKKAARQGYPLAQYNAGYMYEKGEGAPQDNVEAAKYYRQAAEGGNQLAQYNLGYMYEKGQGVLPDEVKALMWYNMAAIQGETKAKAARDRITVWMTPAQTAEAQRMARDFKPGAEYKRIMNELRQAAESGTAESQLQLGVMYDLGQGVDVNHAEAAKWFRKAAQKNNLYAQYNLGLFLEEGIGVANDLKEAAYWFLQSAGLGYDKAQYKIGQFYEKGIGVQQDAVEAGKWYILAAMYGHDAAIIAHKNLFNLFSEDQKNAAQRLAREFTVSVK